VDDLEGSLYSAVGHEFLSRVTTMHHKSVDQTFNDWAGSLSETAGVPFGGRVSNVTVVIDADVLLEGWIVALDLVNGPLVEKLNLEFSHYRKEW
jgi:hypothetical protein